MPIHTLQLEKEILKEVQYLHLCPLFYWTSLTHHWSQAGDDVMRVNLETIKYIGLVSLDCILEVKTDKSIAKTNYIWHTNQYETWYLSGNRILKFHAFQTNEKSLAISSQVK